MDHEPIGVRVQWGSLTVSFRNLQDPNPVIFQDVFKYVGGNPDRIEGRKLGGCNAITQ